jgi:hypothetical protein
MAFPQDVVDSAWKRSGGRCECTRDSHNHSGRCPKQLNYDSRGKDYLPGCWEAHHINANGGDGLSNCEILCCECHKKTPSYGG